MSSLSNPTSSANRLSSMLLLVSWLGAIAASLSACSSSREIPAEEVTSEYEQVATTLNGRPDGRKVVVSYFKGVKRVHQTASDLCWAASLEQALAHQGVDIDQDGIVKEVHFKSDTNADKRIDMWRWRQDLELLQERLRNGSNVWVRTYLDGSYEGPILSIRTFVRKIGRELGANRMLLVGISLPEMGSGHIVTVIGAAFPIEAERLTIEEIVGFLLYDPLTSEPYLVSSEELFKYFVMLAYVEVYDSLAAALIGEYSSTKYVY